MDDTALACLAADGAAIAAAAAATPDAPVPTCPGWTMADLATHVAGAFAFATASLLAADGTRPARPKPGSLDDALAALLATIGSVDPEAERPTLLGPRPAAWWLRRMHHEAAVHRVDASPSTGPSTVPSWIAPGCATDGIDELTTDLLPAAARGPFSPTTVRVGHVVVRFDGDGARPAITDGPVDAAVDGDPADLFLLLWGRRSLDDAGITVTGDRAAADATVGALSL